jgi:hypothetical protein
MLSGEHEQLARWKEHFEEVLNRTTGQAGDAEEEEDWDSDPRIRDEEPSVDEIKRAIKKIKSGKSPVLDNIPPETLKVEIDITAAALHPLFQKVWREEKMPADWKKGLIINLPKQGVTSHCNNWSGITLLSVPSKVLTRIILDRIKTPVEQRLRREQAGFREHRRCVDLINTLRVIIEQS